MSASSTIDRSARLSLPVNVSNYGPAFTAASDRAKRTHHLLAWAAAIAFSSMITYAIVRLATITAEAYNPAEVLFGTLLIAAEFLLLLQGAGYICVVLKASKRDAITPPAIFARHTTEPVAVLLAAFNESEDVLEETLAAIRAMDYSAVNLYLLDDSTREECREAAHRLAARYNATLRIRDSRAGYKAGAINDVLPELTEKYIALLDADQRPVESWLKDVVPLLEQDDTLALVQSPQVYVNLEGLPVAASARYQQAIFYEYICEGKAYSNAVFCCGSNCVMRREALLSIEVNVAGRRHFFDETNLTEDFATSVRLHMKGWKTDYVNEPYVRGIGPETLPAYFTQHMRWAMGSIDIGLRLMKRIVRNPRVLTPGQWWEYMLSGTYYFIGFANLVFMATPVAFIMGGVRPFRATSMLFALIFIPYLAFTLNLFLYTMKIRHYPLGRIWLCTALAFSATWIYMKAALVSLFGLKRAFAVTPKGVGGAIPWRQLPAEVTFFAANVIATLLGLSHLIAVEAEPAYIVNTFWAGYHAVLLGIVLFYFNRPATVADGPLAFQRVSVRSCGVRLSHPGIISASLPITHVTPRHEYGPRRATEGDHAQPQRTQPWPHGRVSRT